MGLLPDALPGHQSGRRRSRARPAGKAVGRAAAHRAGTIVGADDRRQFAGALRDGRESGRRSSTAQALGRLDFLVVQDLFLTETAQFADVVLPAAASPRLRAPTPTSNAASSAGRRASSRR